MDSLPRHRSRSRHALALGLAFTLPFGPALADTPWPETSKTDPAFSHPALAETFAARPWVDDSLCRLRFESMDGSYAGCQGIWDAPSSNTSVSYSFGRNGSLYLEVSARDGIHQAEVPEMTPARPRKTPPTPTVDIECFPTGYGSVRCVGY
ncbi:hypothetical protein SAMN05216241_101537 [Limimonas halophila]|uniref:Uncharacterized protein n=1 Tax=Limimonas halophila TaxID=1082479 RepID=A0A1G7MA49_9PROT|nr:hypothetical protein [Limimonas halophila]SDF58648.1 hypothetical protein SAMN05216241_101537 [Limimonas halophila]